MRTLLTIAACGLGLFFLGCETGGDDYTDYTPPPVSEHEYHAEHVFDAESKAITVYLFGHDLDDPLPIAEESIALALMVDGEAQTFSMTAASQEGEAEGSSSRFELAGNAVIAEHFDDVEQLQGHVEVVIEGNSYKGEITHDHAHPHDHDEGHDEHAEGEDHPDHQEDGDEHSTEEGEKE